MYRVLLPVDDDPDRARDQATFVTDLPVSPADVEVVVTHTLTGPEVDAPDEVRNVDRVETVRLVRDELQSVGFDVELVEARQPPAGGILELVSELDVDHVAMGSRKRSPTGKVVFGSVSQQVLLEADVPVTVVGPAD